MIIDYNKSIVKNVYLYMNLNNLEDTSYLAPILGQYGVKPSDFLLKFCNELIQKLYLTDFIIPINVLILANSEFYIKYNKPNILYLLKTKQYSLNLLDLYKISLIKSFDLNSLKISALSIKFFFKVFWGYKASYQNSINVFI